MIATIATEDFVFIDESGANLQMAPRYGRGYKGKRVHSEVPLKRGSRLTLISAISPRKVEAALYGEWAANGEIFLEFITNHLGPVLRKGQVVVMDNVAFHRVAGIKEQIEARGARLLYLPPYSPELSPIENMWGKIKTSLRQAAARSLEAFQPAIKHAFEHIQPADLRAWFRHCGYSS